MYFNQVYLVYVFRSFFLYLRIYFTKQRIRISIKTHQHTMKSFKGIGENGLFAFSEIITLLHSAPFFVVKFEQFKVEEVSQIYRDFLYILKNKFSN